MTDQSIHQDEEIWKPVVGYEGHYLVSNYGSVFSIKRNKKLKLSLRKDGYLQVGLCKLGKSRLFLVHRICLHAFCGLESYLDVNHINGVKSDNNLKNLEPVYTRENCTHGKNSNFKRFTGVYLERKTGKFVAKITIDSLKKHLGTFKTQEEAADAYALAVHSIGETNKYIKRR